MTRAAPPRPSRAAAAARSFTTARATCGMRAAGVPGRGENGKTCRCVRPHSSTRSSERANIASVSVGKPAMMSAPNTTSGRSRRTCSQNAMASARRCRRFMRLRIRSSPACSDRCRCGISRGSLAKRVEQVAVGLDRIDRRQPQPRELRHVLQDLLHQRAEPRRARQVRAVAGEVDAGEHDLAIAALARAGAPARPPRPSAPSANCRGRKG